MAARSFWSDLEKFPKSASPRGFLVGENNFLFLFPGGNALGGQVTVTPGGEGGRGVGGVIRNQSSLSKKNENIFENGRTFSKISQRPILGTFPNHSKKNAQPFLAKF